VESTLVDFVERYPSITYWMDALTCRDATKRSYLLHFRNFCRWLSKTPEELVTERKEDLESDDRRIQHNSELQMTRYINYLKSLRRAPDTVRLAYHSVRSFYDNNYLTLELRANQAPKKGWPRGRATKEQVATLLSCANTREKALVLLIKDSGLAVADVAQLSYKDIQEEFEAKEGFVAIKFVRVKTGIPSSTFIGPEALDALRDYIELRRRGTRDMYPASARHKGVSPETITGKSPLFVQHDKTHARLKAKDLSRIIKRLAAKAGEPSCTAHRIRKLFQTCLEDARVPFNWIQYLMAHKPLGVEGNYSLPSAKQLRDAYAEAYQYLQLKPSRVTMEKELASQRQRIEDLENKNLQLKQRLNGFVLSESQVSELLRRIENLEKQATSRV
jgi:integrase